MINRIDHVVLTTRDEKASIHFYTQVLGMTLECFDDNRKALTFGQQKINLHLAFHEFEPRAHLPVPGSQDWCFIADVPLDKVIRTLTEHNVLIEEGPVERTGATGPIRSVYVRDPDGNLIEISEYLH